MIIGTIGILSCILLSNWWLIARPHTMGNRSSQPTMYYWDHYDCEWAWYYENQKWTFHPDYYSARGFVRCVDIWVSEYGDVWEDGPNPWLEWQEDNKKRWAAEVLQAKATARK